MKYAQCVFKIAPSMKMALDEVPRRGGLYNWLWVFKGELVPFNMVDDFEKYDVVQINCSPVDQLLVREVRNKIPKSSSTLLVLNNDYVCEAWDTWGAHPMQYEQVLEYGDCVFGTEPHQTSCLRDDAYVIPHPHWIKMLKHIGNDDLDEDDFKVAAMYHWWEKKSYTMSLAFLKLRKKYPKLYTRLFSYIPNGDPNTRWQKVMFDEHINPSSYPEFIRGLMNNRFLLENCSYHTYGRTSVDTAALRIPTVGTDRVFSMKHCWKNMCCDPFNVKKLVSIMDKVLKGGSWLDQQIDYAYNACEYFNYKNSKERYMVMIEETRKRLKK